MRDSDHVRGMCDYVCVGEGGRIPVGLEFGIPMGPEFGIPMGLEFGISYGRGGPMGSEFGISYFPIILEKSLNLLIFDVYTVKNAKTK